MINDFVTQSRMRRKSKLLHPDKTFGYLCVGEDKVWVQVYEYMHMGMGVHVDVW